MGRYVFDIAGILIEEMMMRIGISVEVAFSSAQHDAAQEIDLGELMQRIVHGGERNLDVRFGSFLVKHRAQKTGRILKDNTTIVIPAHNIPFFKPADVFVDKVKNASKKTA